jgi:hypothetical protein
MWPGHATGFKANQAALAHYTDRHDPRRRYTGQRAWNMLRPAPTRISSRKVADAGTILVVARVKRANGAPVIPSRRR